MQFVGGGGAAAADFHYFHHSAFFRSCLGDQLTNEDGGKAKQSKFEVGHFPTNLPRKQQQQQQKAHLISLNSTRKREGDEKQNLVSIFRRTLCPSFSQVFPQARDANYVRARSPAKVQVAVCLSCSHGPSISILTTTSFIHSLRRW